MNAMLNITIRVNAAQAATQVNQLRGAINQMGTTGGATAGGGMSSLNKAFQMSNLEKFGKNLQWTGRQLEYNFTLPLLLAGGAATKFALDNEAAFTQVRKAYGAFEGQTANTNAELDALRRTFELLSDRFGINQKEVISIASDWAQAGAAGVALAKATRLTMETMVLGQESASQATESLLTIQGAYRLNTDQLRGALVSLNAVQVTTAIEFGGLVDAVSRAAGAASTAGIDIQHLAAMAAALVPATGSAAAAGNALRTVISRLMSPTKQAAEELGLMGINVNDASWQALDGVQRIEALSKAFQGLSDGQKNLVSSVIASRWQINRFDILMSDIANSTGVYNTALANTSDTQKANALYAQQLVTVLSSTPQAFKILTTNIQNALAKAILPLLPALVSLLSTFARLTNWFANLDPSVKQLVMTFLLLLAAVGPVTRYLGSFTLLGTTVAKGIGFMITSLFGLSAAQLQAAAATEGANISFIHQHGILGSLWVMMKSLIMLPGRLAMAMLDPIVAAMMGIGKIILFPFKSILSAVGAQIMGFLKWLTGPLIAGIQKVGALITLALPEGVTIGGVLMVAAIIAAIAIVMAVVWKFHDKIIEAVTSAFNALPAGIKNALVSVINMVKKFAMAVYEWLSYINPFARHSPSLVDNVTRGVSTILDQYSRLSRVADTIRAAAAAQQAFADATGVSSQKMALDQMTQQKSDIVAVAPDAGPAVDNLINSIFAMQDALKAVNAEWQDQQRLVDDMQRQIDQDMKPYNDAIWANEYAQKQLRLEILKLKEAGKTIDDVKNKMASLQGEIETLQGQKTELRLAGAGSDILNGYDQQINALKAQQNQYAAQGNELQKLQDQLDQLQNTAERINLEKDLTFDPQLKALDEQKTKLDDLHSAYSDINTAISDMEQALNSMASAAKTAAGDAASLNASQFDAAANANFPDVTGTTIPGLGREGGLADIQNFNDELQKELDNALSNMGGFDIFAPFKDMWKTSWTWIKDNVGPYVQPVIDGVNQFFLDHGVTWDSMFSTDGLKQTLQNVTDTIASSPVGTIFASVGDAASAFVDFLTQAFYLLLPVFVTVVGWLVDMGTKLGNELKQWAPMFGKLVEAVGHILNILVPIFKVVLGAILVVWMAVWPILKNVLGPILSTIVGMITSALQIIRGIISFVLDLINGDWSAAWGDILTIVDGTWNLIYEVISAPVKWIWGLIKGLVEDIVGFFQWLWDELVGHSIIPDMVNAIIWWFNFMLAPIKAVWDLLWAGIQWAWDNVGSKIFEAIKIDLSLLGSAFSWLWNSVVSPVWGAIVAGLSWAWNNGISPIFEAIKSGIGAVGDAMSWVNDHVIQPVWGAITGAVSSAFSAMGSIIENGINFFIDAFNLLARAINAVSDTLGLGFHIDEKAHISIGGGGGGGGQIQRAGAYARGGIPVWDMGGPGGITNIPTALVGEGNNSYPEYVIPTDPAHRQRALALFASLGTRLLDAGDIIGGVAGGIKDTVGGVAGGIKDTVLGAADLAKKFWDIINQIGGVIGNISVGLVGEVASALKDKVVDWGVDKINSIPGVGLITDTIGGIKDVGGTIAGVPGDIVGALGFYQGGIIPSLGAGGVIYPRPGGTLVRVAEKGQGEAVVHPLGDSGFGGGDTYNFYGNLEFPNITKSEDAGKFLKNLSSLVN